MTWRLGRHVYRPAWLDRWLVLGLVSTWLGWLPTFVVAFHDHAWPMLLGASVVGVAATAALVALSVARMQYRRAESEFRSQIAQLQELTRETQNELALARHIAKLTRGGPI